MVRKIKFNNIGQVRKITEQLVVAAEGLFGASTGEQKKQWVVDQLNARIDIPVLGEKTEELIFSVLVEITLDVLEESNIIAEFQGRSLPPEFRSTKFFGGTVD